MTDPSAISPEQVRKRELRVELRDRLESLSAEERRRSELAIHRRLLDQPEVKKARGVFTCLAFGAEVATRPLIEHWIAEGKRVYLPRTRRDDPILTVHEYPCRLTTLSFGLEQPARDVEALTDDRIDTEIDVAIILGLGFDPQGYRLGYGAGYFDRFLASRPFPTFGVGFSCQRIDRLPVEAHDVPMTRVISA